MSIPKGVQFQTVKPQGFYQEYRDYFVTPVQTYSNQFSINDIIRIQFKLDDFYIDPYESYIEAEVRLKDETVINPAANYDPTLNQVQYIEMDGPSTSLINDFRFEVNSREIERIREYDQVGNLLTDLNMYPDTVDQKDYEGYYSLKGNFTTPSYSNGQHRFSQINMGSTSTTQYQIFNLQAPNYFGREAALQQDSLGEPSMNSALTVTPQITTPNVAIWNHTTISNEMFAQPAMTTARNINQYLRVLSDATDAQVAATASSISQNFSYGSYLGSLTSGNTNFGIHKDSYTSTSSTALNNILASSGILPCQQSPKLDQIDGHNIFLTNLPTAKIYQGKFVDRPYEQVAQTCCSRAYMQIPLLSGVMGVLIPQDRWQLIPSSSLGQVNMEFRLNPFAFFSYDGTQPQWIITKFQLRLRLYRFDAALMSQLRNTVNAGIQLHSQIFSMGPIYNIQPNVSVTNTWQLNNGIPSIKQLFFWFLSDDAESYWYCRKNFKLSQNITSMQLKVGSTYIPQIPIIGHAGNIVMNTNALYDNSVYLSELHQAMNCLFDCKRHININKLNFAINQRPYDVTATNMSGLTGATLTDKKKRLLLHAGWALYNEKRCRGKAVYAFNLEMDKKNDSTMTGMDTTKVRPIELILKSDDPQSYSRNSTMYVMFLSDFVVTFNGTETQTEGAG